MKKRSMLAGAAALILMMTASAGAELSLRESTKGGKVIRKTWVDEGGQTVSGPEGYAYTTYSYSGTSATEKYFDAGDMPFRTAGGYYGRIMTYGNRHRLEEIAYLDENGEKAPCAAGYTRVKMSYTSKGQVTSVLYYDENGKLMIVPALGYAAIRAEYRGTALTSRTYLDENRNPVDTPLGYASVIQGVNKSNQVLSIRFERADGSPAACAEGWASCRRTWAESWWTGGPDTPMK